MMRDLKIWVEELEAITALVGEAVRGESAIDAVSLRFLLRRYRATGSGGLRDVLEPALAGALARYGGDTRVTDRAAWLSLFVDALAIADDPRVADAAAALARTLMHDCAENLPPAHAAAAVEACLATRDRRLVPSAVDELERIVGGRYRAGEGIAGGAYADQVCAAAALLTGYEVTARLPYAMLAEELMQVARRSLPADPPFVDHCEAVRVFCRLAALHRDETYRAAAVLAPGADYRGDAELVLTSLAARGEARRQHAAAYGLAVAAFVDLH